MSTQVSAQYRLLTGAPDEILWLELLQGAGQVVNDILYVFKAC